MCRSCGFKAKSNVYYTASSREIPSGKFAIDGKVEEGRVHSQVGNYIQWSVFGIMAIATILFHVMARNAQEQVKTLFFLANGATGVCALSYLIMATNGALSNGVVGGREIVPVRYIEAFVSMPLLVACLCQLAGSNTQDMYAVVGMNLMSVVAAAAATYSQTVVAKWCLFAFATLALIGVLSTLVTKHRDNAHTHNDAVWECFNTLVWLTFATWVLYPVVWGVGVGGDVVSVDMEIILYAVLDVASKAVFGFILLANASDLHMHKEAPQAVMMVPLANAI
eukprot:GDKI01013283.1.p1 GENE.GDKI01013283.1~~GDKI01013283.1.p1  ORF type:complete len:280 (+),score=137.84 GDKI01013283.1:347-1186(+)